ANRALVALAAQTLELLPSDLESEPLNLSADDPEDNSADLSDLTALSALRLLRAVVQDVPPEQFAGIGYPTRRGFENLNVLGPRAHSTANRIADEWLAGLGAGWDHSDALRACLAA